MTQNEETQLTDHKKLLTSFYLGWWSLITYRKKSSVRQHKLFFLNLVKKNPHRRKILEKKTRIIFFDVEKLSLAFLSLTKLITVSHLQYIMTNSSLEHKLLHHHNGTLFSPLSARMQCNSFVTLMSLIGSFNSFCSRSPHSHFSCLLTVNIFILSCAFISDGVVCLVLSRNTGKMHKTNNHSNYISCTVVFYSLSC